VLYNPNLEYRWFLLPSLVAIITIDCLMVTALSLAREREEGTFDQLLVSPAYAGLYHGGQGDPRHLGGHVAGHNHRRSCRVRVWRATWWLRLAALPFDVLLWSVVGRIRSVHICDMLKPTASLSGRIQFYVSQR
jgi:hypothetical protein